MVQEDLRPTATFKRLHQKWAKSGYEREPRQHTQQTIKNVVPLMSHSFFQLLLKYFLT